MYHTTGIQHTLTDTNNASSALLTITTPDSTADKDWKLGLYSVTEAAESAGAAFWKDCRIDARLSDISRMFSRVTGRSVDAA